MLALQPMLGGVLGQRLALKSLTADDSSVVFLVTAGTSLRVMNHSKAWASWPLCARSNGVATRLRCFVNTTAAIDFTQGPMQRITDMAACRRHPGKIRRWHVLHLEGSQHAGFFEHARPPSCWSHDASEHDCDRAAILCSWGTEDVDQVFGNWARQAS